MLYISEDTSKRPSSRGIVLEGRGKRRKGVRERERGGEERGTLIQGGCLRQGEHFFLQDEVPEI